MSVDFLWTRSNLADQTVIISHHSNHGCWILNELYDYMVCREMKVASGFAFARLSRAFFSLSLSFSHYLSFCCFLLGKTASKNVRDLHLSARSDRPSQCAARFACPCLFCVSVSALAAVAVVFRLCGVWFRSVHIIYIYYLCCQFWFSCACVLPRFAGGQAFEGSAVGRSHPRRLETQSPAPVMS